MRDGLPPLQARYVPRARAPSRQARRAARRITTTAFAADFPVVEPPDCDEVRRDDANARTRSLRALAKPRSLATLARAEDSPRPEFPVSRPRRVRSRSRSC